MKLKVIVDNNTYIDQYYLGEPALSFYMEEGPHSLLFDTGYSDVFLRNLAAFGIDPHSLNNIVLSHGHDDHTGGLKSLFWEVNPQNLTIHAHPETFDPKYEDSLFIGSPFSRKEMESRCTLNLSREPVEIFPGMTFLGEIPEILDFEKVSSLGIRLNQEGVREADFLRDDSALVYQGKEGLYILSGCSHRGICNTIEYARRVTGCSEVKGVMGGFHLFETDERCQKTIAYLKTLNLEQIYPCHCTSFAVKAALNKEIPVKEVGVGMELNWI
jgi:7,8-dihydropterin-6-yl-methyl-4-(beta-D-ribofuranosyl)aminobenzene 5'-phosphate synthase